MSMKSLLAALLLVPAPLAAAGGPGELHIVTTGDVHGSYFNRPYVGNKVPTSLMSVKHYVDSLRAAVGPENVVLLDAGDVLQGNNASYYYNYVATGEPHVWPRMAAYMGYDACTMGNHDVEAGHPVYDRVRAQLEDGFGIPWLAGNALKEDGSPAFPEYALLDKGGRKVLVLGFNNANIAGWLSPELWSGAKYVSLVPLVQNRVYYLKRKLNPDAVIVVVHSGTGAGDGRSYESQGLDIYNTLRGVDVVVTAHDHRPVAMERGLCCLVNGGSRAGFVGHAVLTFGKCGKVKTRTAEVVRLDKNAVDKEMVERFDPEFQAVKAFTVRPVGELEMPLRMRDAYTGMCDYIDLLHTVQLEASGALVSIAAPLTYNGYIPAGQLVFNDMFTIYPFENQLFVLRLTGREIKDLMEYSYDHWICTPGEHVLKIANAPDPRTGANKWSFVNRSYNFDSAAGISYTVDVTKPAGSRVVIESLADGSTFKMDGVYTVAMTSYRANGGGSLLTEGAGIAQSELATRVVARYPEIRNLIYDYIREHGKVGPGLTGRRSVLGAWRFVPESVVNPLMKQDMELVF
ncbi:MAG: 5'-nucleotidase C-terminal domain-containing protein [Bacteroidales bacterium]|nr:5'-nucleotidase C-terminal domain-containing protein [Bacteroidales bacterium]